MPDTQAAHILMDHGRVNRALHRIAFQIAESVTDPDRLIIAGLNERGFDVARILSGYLSSTFGKTIHPVQLDVDSGEDPEFKSDTTGKYLLLVDDVLFSGRTMLRALDVVVSKGEPEWIKIAVLVDRGHRKFPLYPEYSGMRHPTKFREHVHVDTNGGEDFSVLLLPDTPVV